jgi:ankyrin repeat protein
MERIEGQISDMEELAKQVLCWITCARRPLYSTELCHALAVEVGEQELDHDNIPQVEDMISACAGLVTVDDQSHIIRLVHYTTQKYFKRTQQRWFPNAEAYITDVCITYLSSSALRVCRSRKECDELLSLNPLYAYTAQYWGEHASQSHSLGEGVLTFLQCDSRVRISVQPSCLQYPVGWTGLHMAASLGLEEGVRMLLQSGVEADARNEHGHTALGVAAARGRATCVKVLLQMAEADPNAANHRGRTPIFDATCYGHLTTAKLLLGTGQVDLNVRDDLGQTCVFDAIEGDEALLKMLLDTGGVDLNVRDKSGQTCLFAAIARGPDAIVKLLLDTGQVDLNVRNNDGETCLIYAITYGRDAVIKLLLDTGQVGLNIKDHYGMTCLSRAAATGQAAVVKLILDTGKVDPNDRDNYGGTCLFRAAAHGHAAVVKLLLDIGTLDADAKQHTAPGIEAVTAGSGNQVSTHPVSQVDGTVMVDLDVRDIFMRTPLWYAAAAGHHDVVKSLLLHERVDRDLEDHYGLTPLAIAAWHERTKVVEMLLAAGNVDIMTRDCFGRTPLWYAKATRNADLTTLMVSIARKAGTWVCDDDEPLHATESTASRRHVSNQRQVCDICQFNRGAEPVLYHCEICNGGDLDVCGDCYQEGGRCLEPGHQLRSQPPTYL